MKTRFINMIAALLGMSLLVSCQKETDFTQPSGLTGSQFLSFTASLDAASTKTYLDGVQVKWQMTDSIKLWYGTAGTEMTGADYFVGAIDAGDARKATFDGFAKESPDYMAVYPLSASLDCSKKGKLTVMLPSVQKATKGSFAQNANVAVAASNTTDLAFKNIGGLLAVRLESTGGHDIVSIRLAGENALAGEVEIKKADLPAIDAVTDGTNCVTIFGGTPGGDSPEAGEGWAAEGYGTLGGSWYGQAEILGLEPGDYYAVTLPGSHTSFSITLVDDQGRTAVARSNTPFDIVRNGNTLIAKITAPTGEWAASPKVFINEIHTHNNQIELWNPNDFSVDLTGWLLVKDEKSWAFPVGSVISAKGYKVITAGQTDCASGPMFGISGDKGFVLSLVSGTTVDKVDNSGEGKKVIGTTETYGRKTDGSSEWVVFINDGTIYESGVCDGDNSKGVIKGDEPVPVIDYTGLVINEVNGNDYNAENANDKFIELYNGSAGELDLTGVVLKKDGETVWTGAKDKHVLASGAYLVLYSNKSEGAKTCPAENVFSSGLSPKKAVRVQILTPGGESIDDFNYATYSGTPAPASYGRNSGSGEWYYQAATPGAVNADGTEKVTGLQ